MREWCGFVTEGWVWSKNLSFDERHKQLTPLRSHSQITSSFRKEGGGLEEFVKDQIKEIFLYGKFVTKGEGRGSKIVLFLRDVIYE